MRLLLLVAIGCGAALAQVAYTAPVPPVAAKPASLTATAGNVKCTLTGDTAPAANITIACSLGAVTIQPFTIPISTSGTAFTFQYNFNGQALTVIINAMQGQPANVTATVNGSTAQWGNF